MSSTFIPDMIRMLDNVLEHFIQATYDFVYDYKGNIRNMEVQRLGFEKAGYSAYRERSIGLGAMGFHTYLQKLNIPFDSPMAMDRIQKCKQIKELAVKTSKELAEERVKLRTWKVQVCVMHTYLLLLLTLHHLLFVEELVLQ